jgi:DNA polymerase III sliding clamp (beta) subunit (PCNA family)
MKFTISLKELKEAVAGLSRVVSGKVTLPILGAVKISGDAEGVKITGTNLTEYLSRTFEDATGEGEFILDFRELKEFIKGSKKSGDVTFDIADDRVLGQYYYNDKPVDHVFVRLPEKDWPTAPVFIAKLKKITADALESIMLAMPLASKDDSRRTLNGVLLESGAVVASDGKQLVKFHGQTGVKDKVILPKTKVLTGGLLSEQDGRIAQNKAYVQIKSGPWEYTVKGIAGTYPQYQHVIPKDSECSIAISNKDAHYLKSALPLLESSTEHKAVHLYAANGDVRFLSENLKSLHVKISANFTGEGEAVLQMNRDPLLQALQLGFNKFSFSPGGVNPIMATGRGDDVFVFMSLHGGLPADQVIKAVEADNRIPQVVDPTTPADSRNNPQEATMPKENTENNAGLQVVQGESVDPFESLFDGINQLKQQARETITFANDIQQTVRTIQKNARRREREFKSTRSILDKLKQVSGF